MITESSRQVLSLRIELVTPPPEIREFIADVAGTPFYEPIDVEFWLDVEAGMQVFDRKKEAVETVASVKIFRGYPPAKNTNDPLVKSGREWERTGLGIDGMPTC